MFGIFTNICPKNHPNVGKYTMHGASKNGKSPALVGKSTISMAIFNSYVSHYQRVYPINIPLNHYKVPLNHYKILLNHYKSHGYQPFSKLAMMRFADLVTPTFEIQQGAQGCCRR